MRSPDYSQTKGKDDGVEPWMTRAADFWRAEKVGTTGTEKRKVKREGEKGETEGDEDGDGNGDGCKCQS